MYFPFLNEELNSEPQNPQKAEGSLTWVQLSFVFSWGVGRLMFAMNPHSYPEKFGYSSPLWKAHH